MPMDVYGTRPLRIHLVTVKLHLRDGRPSVRL